MTTTAPAVTDQTVQDVAAKFRAFLETGAVADGLFTPDAFCDFTLPLWRVQAEGRDAVVALRTVNHPEPSAMTAWRVDRTATGLLVEVAEAWTADGQDWTCRELIRADLRGESIADLSVYCTGDWDAARRTEHAAAVTLARP